MSALVRRDEKLLWAGRPDPAVRFAKQDALLIPFSILWGGFAIFWELTAITEGAGWFFAVWGLPFVAFGLYFIFGRFLLKRRRKERTVYGLTDKRAIVKVGESVMEVPLSGTPIAVDRRGGHATVTFGYSGASDWMRSGYIPNAGMELFARGSAPVAFYDVADGNGLVAAIDRAREA